MGVVTNLLVVDVIPSSDSSETDDSSEPSVAVDPLNTNQIVVGAYGVYVSPSIVSPFFTSIDGGTAWTTYGELDHNDKSLAWSQDGSTLFAATLVDTSGNNAEINTYSGTISGSDFGSPINTFNPVRDLDQPWIRTGSGGEVYVAYNDITSTGVDTANVLVSSNGGSSYTSAALDRNSGSIIQDAPAVRLAVNGATVYGAFTRWTSVLDSNADETRYNADVYVVRSDSGGADGFDALGSGGLGVNVASPTGWFADTSDGSLTLGKNRTGAGSELAIAVDPNNAGHVVIAYGTAPGASIDSGELGLVVTESFDSGSSWAQKFATPVTSGGIKSSMPAVAIAADGMIAMLYCSYDPSTDELSQQLLTTNDDFATSSTITLATESNAAAPAPIDPYLGDFYDLTCIGNTFYGIFAAANADNGTDASFPTVTFQRSFTGTAGTSNFQLVTSSGGSPVSASIDPFFFSFMAAVTVSSGTTIVSSATNESYIVVDSGTLEVASGGTVSGEITISSGGSVLIDSGGTVLDTLISSGGVLQVSSGGVADPTTIVSGGTEIVSAGGTDSGALISGGEQDVFGVASGATVFNGGFEVVSSGGAASATVVSSGGTLELLSGGSVVGALVYPGGSLAVGAGTPNVTGLRIIDVIPASDSAETDQNSEPSLAVNPLAPTQIIAGAFGNGLPNPYFETTNGGTTWLDYGELDHVDKSLAWSPDGSTAFTATLVAVGPVNAEINTYSGTTSGSDFGSPINTFNPAHDLDQPWIRTGPSGHVYVAYNDLTSAGTDAGGTGNGETAYVLVSTNGGSGYTPVALDRVGATNYQDAPAVRLAVNGGTVYAAFTHWTSVYDSNADETRYNAQVVLVRDDNGGADSFGDLGSGGVGVTVATPIGWFADTTNGSLTLGQNRTASDLAIAVDPNNANHVVVAYGTAPGATIDSGELGLVVTESTDGGANWTQKFATNLSTRSSLPALAIATDGTIAMLYGNYDPTTDELSQHLLTTSDDFATTADLTLATESNATPLAPFDPYLGDFYDLTSIGSMFYGIFSASNADNGTDATFPNVTFGRDYTGTPGTSSFQLTANGNPVAFSIDPYFFSFQSAITISSGTTIVSSATNESYIVVDSGTLEVASGGTVSGQVIVSSGGSVLVESSGSVLDTLVGSGGTLEVLSGGLADPTTIFSGGTEIVSGGGTDFGALISGGEQDVFGSASGATVFTGSQAVESGGKATDTIVSNGGTLAVLAGGTADPTIISSGGTEIVNGGGTDLGALISGGMQTVFGFASGAVIFSGGNQTVSSGGTASSTTVSSGGVEVVFGSARGTIIDPGGFAFVSSGGTGSGAIVDGGVEFVYGAAGGTIVNSGSQYIQSGGSGSGSGAIVNSGGATIVSGTISGTLINSGGIEDNKGIARGAQVNSGGLQIVESGALASGTVANGTGAEVLILSGGTVSGTTLSAGGFDVVRGLAVSTTINNGGIEDDQGVTSGAHVNNGGLQIADVGGTASGTVVSGAGAQLLVVSGGAASGATLSGGGFDVVRSGGTAVSTTILSGGIEDDKGIARGTQVNSGGLQIADLGGAASGTVVSGTGAELLVVSGATASSATLSGGGFDVVKAGGTAVSTTINSGGIEDDQGIARGALVNGGGLQIADSGGTASGTVVMSGGQLFVAAGGTATGATLSRGFEMVFGTAVSTTVLSGAIVDDRAVTSGTRVNSGALEAVSSGALASGTVVSGAAAELLVSSGGTISGAILSGGGFDVVNAGGTAISTTINSGGIEDDKGLTSATRINNGGIQVVDVGGTASGSFVNSGGVDVVVSGGTASNTTISGGGFMEVRSGGSVGSGTAVTFASGGVLQLDDSVHFGGRLVAGFGMPSLIDLRDIAFISGTTTLNWMQTGTSGTLTVTDGTPATTANITLLGQYAAGNFHIGNDGAGGTVVSDPPVSSTSQLALANTHQV